MSVINKRDLPAPLKNPLTASAKGYILGEMIHVHFRKLSTPRIGVSTRRSHGTPSSRLLSKKLSHSDTTCAHSASARPAYLLATRVSFRGRRSSSLVGRSGPLTCCLPRCWWSCLADRSSEPVSEPDARADLDSESESRSETESVEG